MFRRFSVNFAILSIFLDLWFTFLAFILAVELRPILPHLPFLVPVTNIRVSNSIFLLTPFIWVMTLALSSVYDPKRVYRVVDEFQSVTLANGVAALLLAGILYLFFREFSRWLFIFFVSMNLCFLLGWRAMVRVLFKFGRFPTAQRRVLIVGAGKVGQRVGQMIEEFAWPGLDLIGYLDDVPEERQIKAPIWGPVEMARRVVEQQQITDVVIALPQRAYGKVNQLVLVLHDLPVDVRVVPDYFSLALFRATVDEFGGIPLINLRDAALNDVQRLVKRIFDLVVTFILVLLALPIMAIIALLIHLDSSGPIIFRQQRLGENGRLFGMYKFRSMVVGAEQLQPQLVAVNGAGKVIHKRPDDPRITRIGRLLRRASLDELPQLFNVLKGDMSLVGPRPELPWLMSQYEPWQRKRFAVPQGMTGWWQVNGRADRPMHVYADDDLYYVQHYSLWMDIYILLKTPWVVMRGKGAY